MCKVISQAVVFVTMVAAVIATLMAAQWLAWYGPEWIANHVKTSHGTTRHMLAFPVYLSCFALILAEAGAGAFLLCQISDAHDKGEN